MGTHAALTAALDAMAANLAGRRSLIETSVDSHPWALVDTLAAYGGLQLNACVVILDPLASARMHVIG